MCPAARQALLGFGDIEASFLIIGFGSHLPFLGNNREGSIAIASQIESITGKVEVTNGFLLSSVKRKVSGQGTRVLALALGDVTF